jgi:hypothetical protein
MGMADPTETSIQVSRRRCHRHRRATEEIGCPSLTGDTRLADGAEHAKSYVQVEVFTP